MARLILLVLVIASALHLLTLGVDQGRKSSRLHGGKRQARGKQRSNQAFKTDKSLHQHRSKQTDRSLKRLRDQHQNPRRNFIVSYHHMAPPTFLNFRWNMKATKENTWWQGPHICENKSQEMFNRTGARAEVIRHFSTNSQVCDESETVYKCKIVQENILGRRELTVVYECCRGYTRQKGDYGCPQREKTLTLLEKAEEMNLTDFVKAIRTLKLTELFENGNFTMFVPVNGAFKFDNNFIDSGNGIVLKDGLYLTTSAMDKTLKSVQNYVLNHLVAGGMKTSSMEDEQLVQTTASEDTTIRINFFARPEKLMTANCVPFISRDNVATNGVIHSLEKVLRPVTNTLLDIVRSRHDLSTLKTVLAASNYVSKLDLGGHLTLLAPANSAFDKMSKGLKNKLLQGNRECLERVLRNHILPNVICSVAIQGRARTANELHHYINVTRTAGNKFFVNGAQVIQADVMATNGVMHVIDGVLVPIEALSVLDLLQKEGFTEMLHLIEKAGLTKTLEAVPNITLFVPNNKAIQNLPIAMRKKLNEDPTLLRDVINFHMSPAQKDRRHTSSNQLLPSVAGPSIQFNSYYLFNYNKHRVRTVQCVPLAEVNIEACNGHISIIKGMMMPPKGNILYVLALDRRFSTFASLMKKSGIADSLQTAGPFTVFVPNNEAFNKLDKRILNVISKDSERLQKLVKGHVTEQTLCCAGIFQRPWLHRFQIRTLSGSQLRLSHDNNNRLKIGHAIVTKCDQTATNGNVLEIDRVLLHELPSGKPKFKSLSRRVMFES